MVAPAQSGFFFVLQANETGGTGSHQAGEVHVRKSQLGDFFPAATDAKTVDLPMRFYHAERGEFGQITFTHYGGRYAPEARLRKFPPSWRADFAEGTLVIIVSAGDVGIIHFIGPTEPLPPGLEQAAVAAKKQNFGRFKVGRAPARR